jgi:hypothetical protein
MVLVHPVPHLFAVVGAVAIRDDVGLLARLAGQLLEEADEPCPVQRVAVGLEMDLPAVADRPTRKVPSPLFNWTTTFPAMPVVTRSSWPPWLKSPAATALGSVLPAETAGVVAKPPPLFSSTVTLFAPKPLAKARSRLPSPLKSPAARAAAV